MKRAAAALLLLVPLTFAPARSNIYDPWVCPREPTRSFPAGFELPVDRQTQVCTGAAVRWEDPHVGGWGGGDCPAGHVARTPVVFVHGQSTDGWYFNSSDASDGSDVNVRDKFLGAGYCPRELWAITYSGDATPPGSVGSSYNTFADIQAEEVYEFMLAVRDFVGTAQIDVIGHSLGVTVVRKAMYLHRDEPAERNPYTFVRRGLMIAGANHGTTTCRGEEMVAAVEVCREAHPGSPWLAELNAIGESPGPTRWITVCECTGTSDAFYLGPDALSPLLQGADAIVLPGTNHFELAAGEPAIAAYLPRLVEGSAAAAAVRPRVQRPATNGNARPRPGAPGSSSRGSLPATGVARAGSLGVLLLWLSLAVRAGWMVRVR
jgi:pimeloyl-ACP methyl ester carboxylesterase